jgi:hypothetical protein
VYGYIRKVINRNYVFIECQAGEHFADRRDFIFEHGHQCIQRGAELEFESHPNPGRVNRRAKAVRVINGTHRFSQVLGTLAKWDGSVGHLKLSSCSCFALCLRRNIRTADEYIDEHMHEGARLVCDLVVDTQKDGGTMLKAVQIEIIRPSSDALTAARD